MTQPPASPRRAQTTQRLLEAAAVVFAERGVAAATVEQICEQAGFTRGAFYSNFDSKDELCLALLADYGERATAGAALALETHLPQVRRADFPDAVRTAIAAFVSVQRTDRDWILVNAELQLYAARTPAVRDAYAAFVAETVQPIADLVAVGLERAGHRLSVPPLQAVRLLGQVWQQSLLASLLEGRDEVDKADLEENLVVLLRSMSVPLPD